MMKQILATTSLLISTNFSTTTFAFPLNINVSGESKKCYGIEECQSAMDNCLYPEEILATIEAEKKVPNDPPYEICYERISDFSYQYKTELHEDNGQICFKTEATATYNCELQW